MQGVNTYIALIIVRRLPYKYKLSVKILFSYSHHSALIIKIETDFWLSVSQERVTFEAFL